MQSLKKDINNYIRDISKLKNIVRKKLKGRTIKIVSDYNGQPYGSSKKSIKGSIWRIKSVWFNGDTWGVFIDGYSVGLCYDEIEIID
jgi:membrane protein implicated in regulation of membrane protease activity